jgi:hypothetical protein
MTPPGPGRKFTTPGGRFTSSSISKNLYAMAGEAEAGLRTTVLPRRDDGAGAKGDVVQVVLLAGVRGERLRLAEAHHLAGVELAEVDRLGDVAVSLNPVLALLDHHPRRELVDAATHNRRDLEEIARALLGRRPAPFLECAVGRGHGLARPLGVRLRENAHHLVGLGRVYGFEFLDGGYPLATDDEGVLAAQLALDSLDSLFHRELLGGLFK